MLYGLVIYRSKHAELRCYAVGGIALADEKRLEVLQILEVYLLKPLSAQTALFQQVIA